MRPVKTGLSNPAPLKRESLGSRFVTQFKPGGMWDPRYGHSRGSSADRQYQSLSPGRAVCVVRAIPIMKNCSLWTCIFNFMNCMSNMQLERPYCMFRRQNACPCVNCMSNMQFVYSPGKGMHFGKQYTCRQGMMFLDMHIRK